MKKILVIGICALFLIGSQPNIYKAKNIKVETAPQKLTVSSLVTKDSMSLADNKDLQVALLDADLLPQNIIGKLHREHYTIKLQPNLIQLSGNKLAIAHGICDYKTHMLTIANYVLPAGISKTKDILFTQADELNLLHEIGHMWAWNKESGVNYSTASKFENIRLRESRMLFQTNVFKDDYDNYLAYYGGYNDEYYAECFALYFESSESNQILKVNAPLTYKYIMETTK